MYWVQTAYDIRDNSKEWCDPRNAAATCLIALNLATGQLINSTLSEGYSIDKVCNQLTERVAPVLSQVLWQVFTLPPRRWDRSVLWVWF